MTRDDKLRGLAKSWRNQAHNLRNRWGFDSNPDATEAEAATYEECAEDLEKILDAG